MKKWSLVWFLVTSVLFGSDAAVRPLTGRYFTRQFEPSQIERLVDVVYGAKHNEVGASTPLLMDVYLPPQARQHPQPLIVMIHGGGFFGGAKEQLAEVAAEYAAYGFVAVTINYRLMPKTIRDARPENFIRAATEATADGMDAIRFLKTNAAKFGIDPHRIATIGYSAGGWISLINGLDYDTFNGMDKARPGVSSKVSAVIATGVSFADDATCRQVRSMLTFDRTDSPALLFHAEEADKVTTAPWAEAVYLAELIQGSGNACELYPQPGNRHTDKMNPGGPYWDRIAPFLRRHLSLDAR